jgi:hypothetical protein
MADEFSGPDPFLRKTPLELQSLYYPLGFPLQLKTNCCRILDAAAESWGARPKAFDKPPFELRVLVDPGETHPPYPVYRGQEHLMSILSDNQNFAVCDYTRNFAFCRLNTAAADDLLFTGYYFLEAIANFALTQLYLTPVHGACVARKGQGLLLCGPSGAGKTSLAYFCAKKGWTYVSDNESWLVRAGGRLLLGNPQRIRFRESASGLFPELTGRQAAPHPNGKLSIVVSPDAMGRLETAPQCCVERVVFLARQAESPATVRAVRSRAALERFLSELPVYEDWVRKEQQTSLSRIAELNPVELRYSSLEGAWRQLESLIA